MKVLIMVLLVGLMACLFGCSSSYEFGDISKAYCNSTDKEFRGSIKNTLKVKGVEIDVDYCATYHLIDALRGG